VAFNGRGGVAAIPFDGMVTFSSGEQSLGIALFQDATNTNCVGGLGRLFQYTSGKTLAKVEIHANFGV